MNTPLKTIIIGLACISTSYAAIYTADFESLAEDGIGAVLDPSPPLTGSVNGFASNWSIEAGDGSTTGPLGSFFKVNGKKLEANNTFGTWVWVTDAILANPLEPIHSVSLDIFVTGTYFPGASETAFFRLEYVDLDSGLTQNIINAQVNADAKLQDSVHSTIYDGSQTVSFNLLGTDDFQLRIYVLNFGPLSPNQIFTFDNITVNDTSDGSAISNIQVVPEPAALATGLGVLALGAAGLRRWRKWKKC